MCDSCVSDRICYSCQSGSYLNLNRHICQCLMGTFLGQDQASKPICKSCMQGCATCENDYQCLTCLDTNAQLVESKCLCLQNFYEAEKGKCLPCLPQCMRCSNNQTCNLCENGFVFDQKKRSCNCRSLKYKDKIHSICLECQSTCSACVNSYQCESCKPNRVLDDQKQCVCAEGYYEVLQDRKISINGTKQANLNVFDLLCKKCDQTCVTCTNLPTQCTSCIQGQTLIGFRCTCSLREYNSTDSTCKKCPDTSPHFCQECRLKDDTSTDIVCTSCFSNSRRIVSKINGLCVCQTGYEQDIWCNKTIIDVIVELKSTLKEFYENMFNEMSPEGQGFVNFFKHLIQSTKQESSLSFVRQSGTFYILSNVQAITYLRFIDSPGPPQDYYLNCFITRLSTHVSCPNYEDLYNSSSYRYEYTYFGSNVTDQVQNRIQDYRMFDNAHFAPTFIIFAWNEMIIYSFLLVSCLITFFYGENPIPLSPITREEYDDLNLEDRYQIYADYSQYLIKVNGLFQNKFIYLFMSYVDSQFLSLTIACFLQFRTIDQMNGNSIDILSLFQIIILFGSFFIYLIKIYKQNLEDLSRQNVFYGFLNKDFNAEQTEEVQRITDVIRLNRSKFLATICPWTDIDVRRGYAQYNFVTVKKIFYTLVTVFLYGYDIIQYSLFIFFELISLVYTVCYAKYRIRQLKVIYALLSLCLIGLFASKISLKTSYDDIDLTKSPDINKINLYIERGWVSAFFQLLYIMILIILLLAKLGIVISEQKLQRKVNERKRLENSMKYMLELQDFKEEETEVEESKKSKITTQEDIIEQQHLKLDPYLEKYLEMVEQIEEENHINYKAKKKIQKEIDFEEEKANYPEGTQFYDKLITDDLLPEKPNWDALLETNLAIIEQHELNQQQQQEDV